MRKRLAIILPLALAAFSLVTVATALFATSARADGVLTWGVQGRDLLPCSNGAHWVLAPSGDITGATLNVGGQILVMQQNGQGSFAADSSGPVTDATVVTATYVGTDTKGAHIQLSHCLTGPTATSTTVTATATTPTSTSTTVTATATTPTSTSTTVTATATTPTSTSTTVTATATTPTSTSTTVTATATTPVTTATSATTPTGTSTTTATATATATATEPATALPTNPPGGPVVVPGVLPFPNLPSNIPPVVVGTSAPQVQATPTAIPPSPTAILTATPVRTVATVLTEQTQPAVLATPIAPSAGSGTESSYGSPVGLVGFLLLLSGGAGAAVAGRRAVR